MYMRILNNIASDMLQHITRNIILFKGFIAEYNGKLFVF